MSRRTPPPDHPMGALHLPLPETATLSNGVSVWLLPDKRAPVVEFRLVLPTGGRAFDDPEWLGVAGATARLMTAGTPRRTSLQIADEAERYGGSLGFAANTDSVRCCSAHTPITTMHPTRRLSNAGTPNTCIASIGSITARRALP